MELVFQRTLNIQRYRIIAEVARTQKRDELQAVLLLAQERGHVSAKMVADELLGNRPETVGKRLIQICFTHKLLLEKESNYYILTKTGQTALEKEKIFIPERGTWEIWVTDDPLWANALIQIKPFNETQARNEIKNQKGLKERCQDMQDIPNWLVKKLQGQIITPLADDRNAEYRFDELAEKGELVTPDANITATLTIGETSDLLFTGKIINKECHYQEQHPMTFQSAWHQILEQQNWLTRWRTQQEVLDVSYQDLSEQERASFHKDYPISKPCLTDLDIFDDTTINNIPIAPATQQDANHWAHWLLERDTNRYVLKGDFETMQNKVTEFFPDYEITFPEQSEFAQQLRPRAYWYLQAPLDWQI
ncbi:hypothetical protein PN36_28615 [Candidatus Thiomargarita nelsonii]|uniref:Uncharacterized protein n=1 Tax=Candidatus Thiomargarita nelsonii TaxID=1003181 RepID=A0A0A6PMF1_9GAMM|nr:hypothetical protein PN36_28615 [Candidatus Thiomargarita nelsonii]